MKIYLWDDNCWKLFEGSLEKLKPELDKRHITISPSATIGDFVQIGDFTTIGNFTKIGNSTTIEYYTTIGNHAIIGDFAKIKKCGTFTEQNIFLMTGIKMEKGSGTFYKAVRHDFRDFHTGKHNYRAKTTKLKLAPDQNVECEEGYHFMNLWGAIAFGRQQGKPFKVISATIKLKDVLAVHEKLRVKAYSNVREIDVTGLV